MTTQNAVDYFVILQDKYGSPSLNEDEIVDFLNHATNEYLNRVIPDNQGGEVNYEQDKNVIANIQPLIYPIVVTMDGTGLVSNATINAALVTAGAEATAQMLRPMAIGQVEANDTYPVKYTRQNNLWEYERNYFKRPESTDTRYTFVAPGLQFYPTTTSSLKIAVLKKPRVLSLTGPVDPEFQEYVMYAIIAIALQLAGVSTRDQELIEDVRNVSLQGK